MLVYDHDDYSGVDIERLRSDLLDYIGTAAFSLYPMAMTYVARVQNADSSELFEIAAECRWDLNKYTE